MASKDDNLRPLHDDIRQGVERIGTMEIERASLNEEIGSIRSDLESKGIKRRALKMAQDYLEMSEDQRRSFDIAYQIVRDALGAPIQGDLLDEIADMTPEDVAAAGAPSEDPEGD